MIFFSRFEVTFTRLSYHLDLQCLLCFLFCVYKNKYNSHFAFIFCFVSFCLNSSLKYTSLYCFMFFVEFYMLKQFLLPLCCFIFKFKIKFLIINQFLNSFLLNLNFLFSISLFKVGNKFSTFLYLFLSLYT